MIPDLKPDMQELVNNIASKSMYYGNPIPKSIMDLFVIVENEFSIGIKVPFWLPVLQKGRGPRKGTQDHGLVKKIYAWMQGHNLFKSAIEARRWNEARRVTWYINKYGNKHFRSKVFIDIYEAERKATIAKIDEKFGSYIDKITMEVI